MIENYQVPVPKHWLISGLGFEGFVLINTSPTFPKDGKFHTTAVITVLPFRNSPVEPNRIGFWLSLERQWLARDGVKEVEERTVNLGEESISCIGGRQLSAILAKAPNASVPETDAISLHCMSVRGLDLMFVGEPSDVQPFYAWLSQIRRQK